MPGFHLRTYFRTTTLERSGKSHYKAAPATKKDINGFYAQHKCYRNYDYDTKPASSTQLNVIQLSTGCIYCERNYASLDVTITLFIITRKLFDYNFYTITKKINM